MPQWHKLLLPLACLALSIWLVHRFIRWWIATKGHPLDWRARHTASITALVLLGAAAAIALSGVAHQAVWLADAPWWSNGRFVERVEAMNKIRQLQMAIVEFENDHSRYPDSLAELDLKGNPKFLYQSPASGEPPEPIIYLKPREAPVAGDENGIAILVSPLLGSNRDRVVVGFTSGATKPYPRELLPAILETRHTPSAEKP